MSAKKSTETRATNRSCGSATDSTQAQKTGLATVPVSTEQAMVATETRKAPPTRELSVTGPADLSEADLKARQVLDPTVSAAALVTAFAEPTFGAVELGALVKELTEQCGEIQNGNLKRAESMLIAQASSLDAIFLGLANRASANIGNNIGNVETYLKIALRAQSQCRATLETLSAIKNPPVVFAKQANISNGPQQVNNGLMPASRVEDFENKPNELLEHQNGETLVFGKASAPVSSHLELATVESVDRPAHGRRKGGLKP
jgi:hypothetical protein